MAWFVGGLIGRLLGHTYLVGYLGWPEVVGWFSVPIGAVVAWLWVAKEAIVPALKHSYRWTKKPVHFVNWAESFSQAQKRLVMDGREFKSNWGWRVLNATSIGLLVGLWLVGLGVLSAIIVEARVPYNKDNMYNLYVAGFVFMTAVSFLSVFLIGCISQFLEARRWTRFFEKPLTGNEVRDVATENFFCFLSQNPVSVFGILLLIAVPYYLAIVVKGVTVLLGKVIWKTIQMINSSQRMAAMTGAAIGLSISQVYGFNPVICGVVSILAGLVERSIFVLVEKTVRGLKVKQTT